MGDEIIPCSLCGQPASVHLTQVSSSEVKKVHFCEACAAKQGVAGGALAPIAEALSLINKKIEEELKKDEPAADCAAEVCPNCAATAAKTCPRCGMTGVDFLKIRRFGCANCYKTFEAETNGMLPTIQPRLVHTGKIPGGSAFVNAIKETLQKVREEMAAAIKAENYEEAARLRDEIRRLEGASQAVNPPKTAEYDVPVRSQKKPRP